LIDMEVGTGLVHGEVERLQGALLIFGTEAGGLCR